MLAMFCLSPVAKSGVEGNCSDDGVKTTWGQPGERYLVRCRCRQSLLAVGGGAWIGVSGANDFRPDTGQEQRIGTSSSFFK